MNDNFQPNDDESPPEARDGTRNHGPELETTPPVAGENHKPEVDKGPTTPVHLMSPEDIGQYVKENSKKVLARHLKTLTKEQIADCCIKYPTFALLLCKRLISKDQLEHCIKEDPLTASFYATELALTFNQIVHCAYLYLSISPNGCEPSRTDFVLLDVCIRKEPGVSLRKAYSKQLVLTDEQFEYCCLKAPTQALKLAPYKMHDALFKKCARLNLWAAYNNAPDRLSIKQLLRYACDHGYVIRNLLAANPRNPIVMKLAPHLGCLDENTAKVVADSISVHI